jgi:hypothetical protein
VDAFEQNLRKTILDHRLETAEQRRRLYEAFAARLAQGAQRPDGSVDTAKLERWTASLKAAQAAIEADHIPLPDPADEPAPAAPAPAAASSADAAPATAATPPTRFGRLVDRIRHHWPILTTISTGLTTIAEFLKPLGEFTAPLLGLGVAATVAGLVARRIASVREFGDAAVAGGAFVAIAAAAMLAIRAFVPDAEARSEGVLAVIPGLQELQSSLLHVGARVDEIAADTRRTADATAQVAAEAGRTADTTAQVAAEAGRIAKAVEVAKREVSEDPAKELANLGINPIGWADAWIQSLKRGDTRILGLLDKAGFTADRDTLRRLGTKENAAMLARPEVRTALRGMADRVRGAYCAGDFVLDRGNAFEPNADVEATMGFVRTIGVEDFRFYCGDSRKLVEGLKKLQRDKWEAQCRQSIEPIAKQSVRGFTCDFDRRSQPKFANFTNIIQPEFGPEIAFLTPLAQ